MSDTASIFRRPDGSTLPPRHHLDQHRGQFRLRVRVIDGRATVGRLIVIPLGTCNQAEAFARRDFALAVLSRAGVVARELHLSDGPDIDELLDAVLRGFELEASAQP